MLIRDIFEALGEEQDVDITIKMMKHAALGNSTDQINKKSYFKESSYNIVLQVF